MDNNRVVVTGAGGFTGIHLADSLTHAGYKVFGFARKPSENKQTWMVDFDSESELTRALIEIQPKYVFHLAAQSYVGSNDNIGFYESNVLLTERLVQAASKIDSIEKILVSSSGNVYGNCGVSNIDELVTPKPVNHYAASKLAMEHILEHYRQLKNILIVRPFNYTGPGQAKHFLVPKIVQHFAENKAFIELGNTDVSRDFSTIEFVVECYLRLATSEAKNLTVNVCSGNSVSLQTILDLMSEIAGYSPKIVVNPLFVRDNEIKSIVGNPNLLKDTIGGLPKQDFKANLVSMFNCSRAQQG